MSIQEDWVDFTHSTETSTVSAKELFGRFLEFRDFVANIPRAELVARHWLTTADDDSSLAKLFFDLQTPGGNTLFRKSDNVDTKLLALWQARARSQAEYICLAEKPPPYSGLKKKDLRKLAQLSADPQVVRKLPAILRGFGIILVFTYALPAMNADGAVFHLSTGQPVVAMSLRFPRLDYFWFTLLHELAHLVLHTSQAGEPIFVDVETTENEDQAERSANRLAKNSIADRQSWRNCPPKYDTSDHALRAYAAKQGVHPSLLAGLLRKESGNYQRYSSIVNEHDVRAMIFEA